MPREICSRNLPVVVVRRKDVAEVDAIGIRSTGQLFLTTG